MFETYIGTTNGAYHLSGSRLRSLGLEGERIWAIYAWNDDNHDTILAGSYGNGMFHSADGGETWESSNAGLAASAFRTICPDPLNPRAVLAGTEPARIFRSLDGGKTWQELDGIREIEGHEDWYLPYSPRAGALRNIYAPAGSGSQLLASVEVGGLLESQDGGATWTCRPVLHDEDIHHITGHPDDPDLLYASLGYASVAYRNRPEERPQLGGIARSRDRGRTWEKLETDYTRATIVPPSRPDLVLSGPAPNVGEHGRIVVSTDGGDTWEPASDGIETPMPDMVELFVAAPDDSIWAICSGGRLLVATPGEWHWRSALPEEADLNVQSVTFVTGG